MTQKTIENLKDYLAIEKILKKEGIDITDTDISIISLGSHHIYLKKFLPTPPTVREQIEGKYKAVALDYSTFGSKPRWAVISAGRQVEHKVFGTEKTGETLLKVWEKAIETVMGT